MIRTMSWLVFGLLVSSGCRAHAILVEAHPGEEERLARAPEEIRLRFDAPVGERYLALAVIDSEQRQRVDGHDAGLDLLDPSIVRASLETLPPGEYQVRYRVQSADGHVVTGHYRFNVTGEKP